MTLTLVERECTEQLARFFPNLAAVQIPVKVHPVRAAFKNLQETTTIEFATPEQVIFSSALPLEFHDRVHISREGLGPAVEASVIALQYHDGRKAVAVQFVAGPCEWMVEP